MSRKRYLIIGDGAAGFSAAQALREANSDAAVAILSDETSPAYFRAALTNYLLGELREDQIWAVPPDFYDSWGIHRVCTRVLGVDATNQRITLSTGGAPEAYDGLLIASGSRARHPSFAGAHLPGVMTLRTVQDVHRVVDWSRARNLERAVVLGGGALGLEWAHGLKERGVHVSIVERGAQFLPGVLDKVASDLLASRLQQAGIEVRLNEEVTEAYAGRDGCVTGVATRSGETLWCQLVAAAIGVECNTEFLNGSGISLTDRRAVRVNRRLESTAPMVWAAGDVAQIDEGLTQLWEPARRQGRIAGQNMGGRSAEYAPGAHYFATRLFDLDFASIGNTSRGDEERVDFPKGTGKMVYRKLVFSEGRLVGALMLGQREARVRSQARALKRLVDSREMVVAIREQLLDKGFDVDGWLATRRAARAPEPQARVAIQPAKIKGTQAIALGAPSNLTKKAPNGAAAGLGAQIVAGTVAIAIPGAAQAARGDAKPGPHSPQTVVLGAEGPRATKMLSIGLHAEAPLPAPSPQTPLDARFESSGQVWAITGFVAGIGSAEDNHIVINAASVAPLHAQVVRYGDALFLRDLGSRGGTWVNGSPLTNAHRLGDGDTVSIGGVQLTFRSSALGPTHSAPATPQERSPRLEMRSGSMLGLSFALGSAAVTIGSAPDATVRLDEMSVGLHHARVREYQGHHYLAPLPGTHMTYKSGAVLTVGQEAALAEGEVFRLGEVDIAYTTAPIRGTLGMLLRPKGVLRVDAGTQTGQSLPVGERLVIGSQHSCSLVLTDKGVAPHHLELLGRDDGFWIRDLSGGSTFLRGSPVSAEFQPLAGGDVLLLGSSAMIRLEVLP